MKKKEKESEKIIYELEQLLNVSQSLTSTLDFTHVLDSLVNICLTHALVQEAGLFLKDRDDKFILQRNHKLDVPLQEYKFSLLGCRDFIDYLDENPQSFYCRDRDEGGLPAIFLKLEIEAVTPLYFKKELVGLFVFKKPLSRGDFYEVNTLGYLDRIGSISAIALKNAQLYESANMDKMTSLMNQHFFVEEVTRYLGGHAEENTALIIMDIDFFRKVNDTYGPHVGDDVLKEVASRIRKGADGDTGTAGNIVIREVATRLKKSTRAYDLIGRFGGEEFSILLPDASVENATAVADRIRKDLEQSPVLSTTLKKEINVTASFGVSVYCAGEPLHYLIDRCNKALQVAKKGGRNRVASL